MIREAIAERLAIHEAQNKLRAMTGADEDQIKRMTDQAQRLADSVGGPLSVALDVLAEQIAFPPRAAPDRLTTLRADVERLMIDAAAREAGATQTGSALRASGRVAAYGTVLDLIDKHAREGQPDANH